MTKPMDMKYLSFPTRISSIRCKTIFCLMNGRRIDMQHVGRMATLDGGDGGKQVNALAISLDLPRDFRGFDVCIITGYNNTS